MRTAVEASRANTPSIGVQMERHSAPTAPGCPDPVEYLANALSGILPRPDELRIEQEFAGDVTVLTIHVPLEHRRYVVGKRGRTIEAIRALLRAYAGRRGQMIVAKLPYDSRLSEKVDDKAHYQNRR